MYGKDARIIWVSTWISLGMPNCMLMLAHCSLKYALAFEHLIWRVRQLIRRVTGLQIAIRQQTGYAHRLIGQFATDKQLIEPVRQLKVERCITLFRVIYQGASQTPRRTWRYGKMLKQSRIPSNDYHAFNWCSILLMAVNWKYYRCYSRKQFSRWSCQFDQLICFNVMTITSMQWISVVIYVIVVTLL